MLSRDCRHRLGSTVDGAAASSRNPYGSRLHTVRPASEVIRAWSRVPRNPRAASSKSCVSENGSAARVAACCLATEAEASFISPSGWCVIVLSPEFLWFVPLCRWPENDPVARRADHGKLSRLRFRQRIDGVGRNRVWPEGPAGKAGQRLPQQFCSFRGRKRQRVDTNIGVTSAIEFQ